MWNHEKQGKKIPHEVIWFIPLPQAGLSIPISFMTDVCLTCF